MAETNPKVMELVDREIRKNPDVETGELYEKARKVDEGIGELTLRQFHARYPLQVKRKLAPRKPRRPRRRRKAEADRQAIRDVLLRFARDVTAAEGSAELIDALAAVDDYVDEVVKAARGRPTA